MNSILLRISKYREQYIIILLNDIIILHHNFSEFNLIILYLSELLVYSTEKINREKYTENS